MRIELVRLQNDFAQLKENLGRDSEGLLKLQDRIKKKKRDKDVAVSNQLKACLEHRNNLSIQAIRKDFSNTMREMGSESTATLQVFPVAASVHLKYMPEIPEQKVSGFPTLQSTGIGALRDWLNSITLDSRQKIAQAFLEDVEIFYHSMQPWANDKYVDTKMPTELRAVWEARLDLQIKGLEMVSIYATAR